MADVTIRESVWRDFVALARKHRSKPAVLIERALRDFVQRQADEELLEATARAARRAKFRIQDTEEIIRQYRREKAQRAANCRSQAKNTRRT